MSWSRPTLKSELGTFTYGYVGATGRLQLVTYPNGQTSSYTYYDNLGDQRLQTIHHRKPDASTLSRFDYTYDAAGNILTWQQQADNDAPTLWTYGYDRADQLTSAVHQTTGGTPSLIKRYTYSYDPAGNRTSEQIDDAVTLATHDSLNRLLAHQPGGSLVVTGTLNEPGRVTINGVPAAVSAANQFQASVPVTAGTNTVNINAVDASGNAAEAVYEVDQAGTSKTFTYDANGNMTSDGTRTFEWDARNQLVAVNVGTHRSEFYYDGLQRRMREVENENGLPQSDIRVLWCETAICEERPANGVAVTRRAFAFGEHTNGTARYFTIDHLGSAREVTDTAGALLARYALDPWGRRTVTAGTDVASVGFTGHRTHARSGLALALYRGYDAGLARWISEDPIGVEGGVHWSAYVDNAPLQFTDDFGLQRNKGERGRTSKPDGTDNPHKHVRPHPKDPSKVIYKDPHTGKDVVKPKPPGFDEYWNNKRQQEQTFCQSHPKTCFVTVVFVAGLAVLVCLAQPELAPAAAAAAAAAAPTRQ